MAAEQEQGTGGVVKQNMGELSYDQPVLEPLCFPEHNSKANFSIPLFCLLCDKMFKDVGMEKSDSLLHHLLVEHQFVIADVDLIADFKSYVHYWKRRFRESPITDFCSVININSRAEDIGPKLQYNLLCDGLPEDKQLREQLQMNKLQDMLQHQQQERTDSHFSRNCLFCNDHFEGNRSVLFQHMVDKHAFNVGLPDNLVHVNELLDKLEEKLNNLQCLFCEKTFKDRPTLKDHMRKKQHKKINPKNKEFDKYYLINYLEVGKNWHDILDADDSEMNRKSKYETWEDWQEESIPIHCLFCEVTSPATQDILTHMNECHNFDLLKIKKNQGLNFYEEVKIVNYIRRQVYSFKCIFCKEKFNSKEALLRHLEEMCHFELPDRKYSWDQPQYFFPTFENDGLLCGLPDDEDEDEVDDNFCENTACGNDDGVNGGIHDSQNHSHHGNIRQYSEINYDVKNENTDGINICEKDDDHVGNVGLVCDHAMVGNDKQPDNKCGSDDCGDDGTHAKNVKHGTENEVNQEIGFPALLVNNDDGSEVCDHAMAGNDKQPDNKCGSDDCGDDGMHARNVKRGNKNEVNQEIDFPAVMVNNDDSELCDHAMGGTDTQPDNKCGSDDCGDDGTHAKNVKHGTENEVNQEIGFPALLVNNDDGSEVCDHAMGGTCKQPDNKCGSDDCGDDGTHARNVKHGTENEVNQEIDFPAVMVNNDDSEVCDHAMGGTDKQPDNKCGSDDCGDDGMHARNVKRGNKNEVNQEIDFPAVMVNNDDSELCDHAMGGTDTQPDNKCGSDDCGDDGTHAKNVKHGTENEVNQEIDFPAVMVNNDDGEVCDHAMGGTDKQPDNKCGSNDSGDDDGEHDGNVGHHSENKLDNDNDSHAMLVKSDNGGDKNAAKTGCDNKNADCAGNAQACDSCDSENSNTRQ